MLADQGSSFPVRLRIAATDITVHENCPPGKARTKRREQFGKTADEKMARVRRTVRMGSRLALENEDFTIRKNLAQMIERPPVAKPKLDDHAGHGTDFRRALFETGFLRRQSPYETVQSAHSTLNPQPFTRTVRGPLSTSLARICR